MFERILEPELMTSPEQVDAYAGINFDESHGRLIALISECLPEVNFAGPVLNLGCGSGDESFRFLKRYPNSTIVGVDGSEPMIARARLDVARLHPEIVSRARFEVAYIPSADIPRLAYVGILSNSLLHHMHAPDAFWETVKRFSAPGCSIFIGDLRRPESLETARMLVDQYAKGEPSVFRDDFYNSLCAAFTPREVVSQLQRAGLPELTVRELGDRHLVVFGRRAA